MDTQTITLDTRDGAMPCYEAVPDATAPRRGAVIVVQEAFGVNDHIEDVTRRFATTGYHAVAPHLFHRTGAPSFGYDDFNLVLEHMGALSDDGILADLDAVMAHLASLGWTPPATGVVGFCMGGRVSFLLAAHQPLGAAVGFYGGGIVTGRREEMPSLLDRIPSLHTPWLGLFGDEDQSIPVDEVEQLRVALEAAPAPCEVVRYPGAGHGFHCDARSSYAPEAATDAWARTLAWLENHLAPPS